MISYVLGLSLCYSLCVAQSNMTEGTADVTSNFGIQSTLILIYLIHAHRVTSRQIRLCAYLSKGTEVDVCNIISLYIMRCNIIILYNTKRENEMKCDLGRKRFQCGYIRQFLEFWPFLGFEVRADPR